MAARLDLTYVLPLRWEDDSGLEELSRYLSQISQWAEVVVVDGSPDPLLDAHRAAFGDCVTHLSPDPDVRYLNGKVDGVVTGLRAAAHDFVVLADDDVRFDRDGLRKMAENLLDVDAVIPQNYFDPLPWHAAWDTARSLVNRAFGHDYPGTLGVRAGFVLGMGGYDGDVLFENLELIRTVAVAGGTVRSRPRLYVRRLPPTTRRFFAQRVRQAYDDFARPARMVVWLLSVPILSGLVAARAWRALAGVALVTMMVAEAGRRRGGGTRHFPAIASLLAPGWLLERGVCAWGAVAYRLVRKGCPYRGKVIPSAATPSRRLRRRFA